MTDPSDFRDVSDFRLPALGADMEKGTLLQWYVKPGDEVKRGQVIAEVDTAKSAIEIEVFENGVVDQIVVPVGTEVPVGTVLAHLRPAATREPRPVAGTAPSTAVPRARSSHRPQCRRISASSPTDCTSISTRSLAAGATARSPEPT